MLQNEFKNVVIAAYGDVFAATGRGDSLSACYRHWCARCCFWAVILAVTVGGGVSAADTIAITVSGTGAAMPVMKKLADDYASIAGGAPVSLVYPPMGSAGAIRGVAAGNLDLGLSAREVKAGEGGIKQQSTPWVKTAFVIIANHPAMSKGITRAEMAAIWSGITTRWPDGQLIRLVMRLPNDSDIVSLRAMSAEMSRAVDVALSRPGLPRAENDLHNLELIGKVPGAIGGNTLGLLLSTESRLTALPVDGVSPTLRTLKDGTYPYQHTIHLLSNGEPKARAFLAYLYSERAMALLERNGFVAAKR